MIGFDKDHKWVYEFFESTIGIPVPSRPTILKCAILDPNSQEISTLTSEMIFREDYFEVSNRFRRGRIYMQGSSSAQNKQIYPPPFAQWSAPIKTKPLNLYEPLKSDVFDGYVPESCILKIGDGSLFSNWKIVLTELQYTNEVLFTLRPISFFGRLPKIDFKNIPESDVMVLKKEIDNLMADVNRVPVTVIDRSREVARVLLRIYCKIKGVNSENFDLSGLIEKMQKNDELREEKIIFACATLCARFHARGKTAEQEKRDLPPPTSQEAELCVQAVGQLIVACGFGRWN